MKGFTSGLLLIFLLLAINSAGCRVESTSSDYIGQEASEIKSLSQQEIRAYQEGQGMGLAKAAELNGYPGPRHVLELSKDLLLTTDQLSKVNRIYERMHARAVGLGRSIIQKEKALEESFASGQATAQSIAEMTRDIGIIQSSLREAHLLAHLETLRTLKDDQMRRYYRLRGYSDALPHEGSHR